MGCTGSRDADDQRPTPARMMTERHCWSHWSRALRRVLLAVACVTASAISGGSSGLPGLSEALINAPPATGPFAYNSFVPSLTVGATYVDPGFGSTVRRVTTDHIEDDLYARNMWWNADETRYFHRGTIINLVTNTVEYTGIPLGSFMYDTGFDPVDPNAFYYYSGSSIHKVTLQQGGTWTHSVYFTAPDGSAI